MTPGAIGLAALLAGALCLVVGSFGNWTKIPTSDGPVAVQGTESQPPPFTHEVDDLTGAEPFVLEEDDAGFPVVEERTARPFPGGVPDGVWTVIAGAAAFIAAALVAWRRNWHTIALILAIGLGAMTAAGIGIHDVKNEGADPEELLPLGWGLVMASIGAILVTVSGLAFALDRRR